VPLLADVARRTRALARGAAGVRAGARVVEPLRAAPRGADAAARRRVRVPDAVLLPQGWHERLRLGALGQPRRARAALPREDGAEARRRLSAGEAPRGAARGVHDAADAH